MPSIRHQKDAGAPASAVDRVGKACAQANRQTMMDLNAASDVPRAHCKAAAVWLGL